MSMSPLHHGISVRDAAMMLGVPESNIRTWLSRGNIQRTPDGQIDPFTLREWWESRSLRGVRTDKHQSKLNPYDHPDAPSRKANDAPDRESA